MSEEVVQSLLRVGRGHRPVEGGEASGMPRKPGLYFPQDVSRDGVRGKARGPGQGPGPTGAEGSPVRVVEVPPTSFGGAVRSKENAGLTPHLPVEVLHSELFPAVGVAGEPLPRTDEVGILQDLQGNPRLRRNLPEHLEHPMLAGLHDPHDLRSQAPQVTLQDLAKTTVPLVVRERAVLQGHALLPDLVPEVAHACEEVGDAGLVAPDVGGLLRHLRHPEEIGGGVRLPQQRGIPVQLVAQDDEESSHEGVAGGWPMTGTADRG